MATILEEFDFTTQREDIDRTHKYPWDTWLDGSIWMIKRGEDFDLEDMVMDRSLRNGAYKRKCKLTMKHPEPGVIVFQAVPQDGASKPAIKQNDIGTHSRRRIVRPAVVHGAIGDATM